MENVQEQPKKERGRPKKLQPAESLKQSIHSRLEAAIAEHIGYSHPEPTFDKLWLNPADYNELGEEMIKVNMNLNKGVGLFITYMNLRFEIEVIAEPDAMSFIGKKEYHEYIASGTKRSIVSSMPEHMKQIYF